MIKKRYVKHFTTKDLVKWFNIAILQPDAKYIYIACLTKGNKKLTPCNFLITFNLSHLINMLTILNKVDYTDFLICGTNKDKIYVYNCNHIIYNL